MSPDGKWHPLTAFGVETLMFLLGASTGLLPYLLLDVTDNARWFTALGVASCGGVLTWAIWGLIAARSREYRFLAWTCLGGLVGLLLGSVFPVYVLFFSSARVGSTGISPLIVCPVPLFSLIGLVAGAALGLRSIRRMKRRKDTEAATQSR